MNQNLLVTKRDGSTERINLDKIHRVLDWAAEGLHNVSISQVELRSTFSFMTVSRPLTSTKPLSRLPQTWSPVMRRIISISPHVWRSSTCVKKPTVSLSRLRCTTMWWKWSRWANTIIICWKTTRKKSSSRWTRLSITTVIWPSLMLPLSSWKANIWYRTAWRRNLRKRPVPLYSGCRVPVLELPAWNAPAIREAFLRRGFHI